MNYRHYFVNGVLTIMWPWFTVASLQTKESQMTIARMAADIRRMARALPKPANLDDIPDEELVLHVAAMIQHGRGQPGTSVRHAMGITP